MEPARVGKARLRKSAIVFAFLLAASVVPFRRALAQVAVPYIIRPINGLAFAGSVGAAIASQAFTVSDSSPVSAFFTATADQPWIVILHADPTTVPGNVVTIGIDTAGLTGGTYTGHVILSIANQSGFTWTNSPYVIPVTLTLPTPETIRPVSPLLFSGAPGATLASQSFTISDTSPISASYTAAADQPWISVVRAGPTSAPGNSVVATVNTAGLGPGTYTGHAIVTMPDQGGYTWTNSPFSVPVTLTVTAPGTAATSHSVSLTWSPSATTTAIFYNVYSSQTSGGPYTKLNTSIVSGPSYTDTTVLAGKTYFYVVTAVDSSQNESAFSTEVSATVP